MRGWRRSNPNLSKAIASLIALPLAACSAVNRISERTNQIRAEADALRVHGEATHDKIVVDGANRISLLASDIHETLPAVEDKVPAWMDMVVWGAVAVIAVAVVVILWQTGLGTAVRVAIGWIPRPVKRDADMAVAMMDPAKTEDAREYIAARRASSPLFDSAYQQARAEQEKTHDR